MRAQRRLGLSAPWSRLTAVFVADVAILLAAGRCPESWQGQHRAAFWVGVALAVLATVLSLVTYRGLTAVQRIGYASSRKSPLGAGCVPAFDHRGRFARQPIGIRENAGHLATVIEVPGPVDLRTVAEGLRQFDVELECIDVVSADTSEGSRRTWCVVRFDPLRCVSAVALRDSIASTLASATERLAEKSDGRALSAAEIPAVDEGVLIGLDRGARRRKKLGRTSLCFWVSPKDITTTNLETLYRSDLDATVVTVRLTPVSEGGARVSAWVRYHVEGVDPAEFRQKAGAGLNPLSGREASAVQASLPAPDPKTRLVVPSRQMRDDEQIVLTRS